VTNPSEFKLDAGRWQMVPVQPTLQMCEAMGLKWESPWDGGFPKLWVAALAASPSPPSEPDGDDLGAHLSQLAEAFGHKPTIVLSRHTFARIRAALATRPAAPDGEVREAMVEASLEWAVKAQNVQSVVADMRAEVSRLASSLDHTDAAVGQSIQHYAERLTAALASSKSQEKTA
jgi:hypothetical protein